MRPERRNKAQPETEPNPAAQELKWAQLLTSHPRANPPSTPELSTRPTHPGPCPGPHYAWPWARRTRQAAGRALGPSTEGRKESEASEDQAGGPEPCCSSKELGQVGRVGQVSEWPLCRGNSTRQAGWGHVVRGGPGPMRWAGQGEAECEVCAIQVITGSPALPGPGPSSFPPSRLLNRGTVAWLAGTSGG